MFSLLQTIVRLFMVIVGIKAARKLASGEAPPMSSREKKMAVVVVFVTLILLAIMLTVIFALNL